MLKNLRVYLLSIAVLIPFGAIALEMPWELRDIRKATVPAANHLVAEKEVMELTLWGKGGKYVIHDDDGVATLAVLNRIFNDAYRALPADKKAAWDKEIPDSIVMKGLYNDALKRALVFYENALANLDPKKANAKIIHEAAIADIKALLDKLRDNPLNRPVLEGTQAFLDKFLHNHFYSGKTVADSKVTEFKNLTLRGGEGDAFSKPGKPLHDAFTDISKGKPYFYMENYVKLGTAYEALEIERKTNSQLIPKSLGVHGK